MCLYMSLYTHVLHVQGQPRAGFVSMDDLALNTEDDVGEGTIQGRQAFCLEYHAPWPTSLVLNRRVRPLMPSCRYTCLCSRVAGDQAIPAAVPPRVQPQVH